MSCTFKESEVALLIAVALAAALPALHVAQARDGAAPCDVPAALEAALRARLSGVRVDQGEALAPGDLRVALARSPPGWLLELRDEDGVKLARALPLAAGECAVAAETSALIVERFLEEVRWSGRPQRIEPLPAPPPPPAPPLIVAQKPPAEEPPQAHGHAFVELQRACFALLPVCVGKYLIHASRVSERYTALGAVALESALVEVTVREHFARHQLREQVLERHGHERGDEVASYARKRDFYLGHAERLTDHRLYGELLVVERADAFVDGDASTVDAADAAELGCAGDASSQCVVFVTSQKFGVTDVAAGDQKCTAAAAAPGAHARIKGRTFRAWTSTAALPATGKLVHGSEAYVLANKRHRCSELGRAEAGWSYFDDQPCGSSLHLHCSNTRG